MHLTYATGYELATRTWTTGIFKWVLTNNGITVADISSFMFLAQVLSGGHEFVDTGYVRQTVTTPTRVVNQLPSSVEYHCDDPTFGTLSGGNTASWLLLVAVVTNDSLSPLVTATAVNYQADGVLEALFTLPSRGAFAATFNCPSDL